MTIQQKILTVEAPYTDGDINTEIATQNADGWMVFSITLSGTDVIILFNKTSLS